MPNSRVYILLVITSMIWGGTFIAGKIAGLEASPIITAFWRFFSATLLLIPLTLISDKDFSLKQLTVKDWVILVLLGASGMLSYNYFFIKGLTLTTAGRASVIVAINPCLIILGSVVFYKEKINLIRFLGIFLALCGTAVVVSKGDVKSLFSGSVGKGEFYMLVCAFSWACFSLLGRKILNKLNPLTAITLASFFGVLLILPLAISDSGSFFAYSLNVWLAFLFLGSIGTALSFPFFYYGITKIGPSRASVFTYLTPVFAISFGALFFKESLDYSLFFGFILTLFGVILVQRK